MTARRRARKSILAPLKSSDIMNEKILNEKILNQLFERAVSKGSYFLEVLANVHTDNPSPLTMADRFDGKPALALPPAAFDDGSLATASSASRRCFLRSDKWRSTVFLTPAFSF